MKKLLKYAACLAILVMVVALFTGCKATGGGWFIDEGRSDSKKCTFGLNAQGKWDESVGWFVYKGQFQFNDHAGNKIHAEVMNIKEFDDTYAIFWAMADEGLVTVWVEDHGEPGPDAGDYIKICYDGETWEGDLEGGNIQIHEED